MDILGVVSLGLLMYNVYPVAEISRDKKKEQQSIEATCNIIHPSSSEEIMEKCRQKLRGK